VTRKPTFDEILAPFREAVDKSEISDEELDSLFTEPERKPKHSCKICAGKAEVRNNARL